MDWTMRIILTMFSIVAFSLLFINGDNQTNWENGTIIYHSFDNDTCVPQYSEICEKHNETHSICEVSIVECGVIEFGE